MAETGKKVDVRYGAFACTIEGYDNPVEQLQLILGEMQKMIAETPQFSQIGTGDEADEIKEALDPQSGKEDGSPGIVVIRDSESQSPQQTTARASQDSVSDAEEVEEPADAKEAQAESPQESSQESSQEALDEALDEAGPVAENVDAASSTDGAEPEETQDPFAEKEPDSVQDDRQGFQATAAAGAAAVSIGAAIFSGGDEESQDDSDSATIEDTVADAAAEDAQTQAVSDDAAVSDALTPNAAGLDQTDSAADAAADPWVVPEAVETADAPEFEETAEAPSDEVEATADFESEAAPERVVEPDSDQVVDAWAQDDASEVEAEAETVEAEAVEAVEAAPQPERAEPMGFNIFADPEPEAVVAEPGVPKAEPEPEPEPEPEAFVNIFADPDAEPEAAPEPEIAQAPAPESEPEPEAAPNIFADPEETTVQKHAAHLHVPSEPLETDASAVEEESTASDSDDASDWTTAGATAAAVAATATAAVNIFADPAPEPEAAGAAESSSPLDAIKEVLSEPVEAAIAESPAADAVNIFANPDANPIAAISDEIGEIADEAASVWDDASETLSTATPDNVRQTLDDLGARLAKTGDGQSEEPAAQESVEPGVESIFAAPAEVAEPRAAYAPVPDLEPEPVKGSRFETLLNQVHGAPVMGAPGDPEAQAPSAPEPAPELASGIGSASDLAQRAGSESVSDLLAASAAWLTLAEGKSRFSRRDVMDVFEQIPGDHPRTLEARIKGYGRLVRSGMLVLVDDGVFAMAQTERDRFQTILDRA